MTASSISATGARGGLVMQHAYHGITDAVAALTPTAGKSKDPRVQTLAPPPVNDADEAIGTLAKNGFAPAAFFIDSALTSNGILDPPPEWLAAVAGGVRAAVIDFGGFLGVGSRKIVVDWNALHFGQIANKGESITLELTKDQVKAAPEYKEDAPIVVLGASGALLLFTP